jgi:enterochelin esterase-like enzyme
MKTTTAVLLGMLALLPASAFCQGQAGQNQLNLPASNREFAPIPQGYDAVRPNTARGTIEYVEYQSETNGIKRRMAVYTPPGYSSATRYPVTYLLHGRGDDETGWDIKGSAGAILDNLIADGLVVPSVVVMPNGQASRRFLVPSQQAALTNPAIEAAVSAVTNARAALLRAAFDPAASPDSRAALAAALATAERTASLARADAFAALQQSDNRLTPEQVAGLRGAPAGADDAWGSNFEQDLIQDIIPFIESRYSVRTDRLSRALLGLSMGGGQTLNFGLSHQDLFAYVAAFSPAPNARRITDLITSPATTNQELKLLWISCGDVDTLVGNVSRTALADLDELGVNYLWRRGSGGHSWNLWKDDLHTVSQMLFR